MTRMILTIFLLMSACVSVKTFAAQPFSQEDVDALRFNLLANIATQDHPIIKIDHGQYIRSIPGAVMASPSNREQGFSQDYQFHWTRDAAIVMRELTQIYAHSAPAEKAKLLPYLLHYIAFENKAQQQISKKGEQTLGQPKFNLDGTIWEGKWTRPQNDGPALRAVTLMTMAEQFKKEKLTNETIKLLDKMIIKDVDYVLREWPHPSYDVWEEVLDSQHFFTKMMQRKAMYDGADYLRKKGDVERSAACLHAAQMIELSLKKNWQDKRQAYMETANQQQVMGGGINSDIVFAVLYGDLHNDADPFSPANDKIISSVFSVRQAFEKRYAVNIQYKQAPLLGRYPTDRYDGDQFAGGNPWILSTASLAQYYYVLAQRLKEHNKIQITRLNRAFFTQVYPSLRARDNVVQAGDKEYELIIQGLINEGDKILAEIKRLGVCYEDHTCLHYAEQIDRHTGQQVSAKDLTWGYMTLLAAVRSRNEGGFLLANII